VLKSSGSSTYDALKAAAGSAGVVIRHIERVEPSLEDVFLEVVSEAA
jgi:hypothetical protein